MELANPFGVKASCSIRRRRARSTITATASWPKTTSPPRVAQALQGHGGLFHDDPLDSLEAHQRHGKNASAATKLLPTWRPDKAMTLADLDAWNLWVDKLQAVSAWPSAHSTPSWTRSRNAMISSISRCRVSDHGLEQIVAEPIPPSRSRTSSPRREPSGRWRQSSATSSARPCSTSWPSWTMPAVGRSSSTWGHAQQQHARDAHPRA